MQLLPVEEVHQNATTRMWEAKNQAISRIIKHFLNLLAQHDQMLPHNLVSLNQNYPNTLEQDSRNTWRHRIPNLLLDCISPKYVIRRKSLQTRVLPRCKILFPIWMVVLSAAGSQCPRKDCVAVIWLLLSTVFEDTIFYIVVGCEVGDFRQCLVDRLEKFESVFPGSGTGCERELGKHLAGARMN